VSVSGPSVSRRRSFLLLSLASLVVFGLLLSLGFWQVRRLAWKEALIAHVSARVASPPQPLPPAASWPGLVADDIEFRPVTLSGQFDHAREVHVYIALGEPKGAFGGQGYFVLTPLTLDDGHIVFVNRGFVPLDKADPHSRPDSLVTGRQEITGLMRPPEPRSWIASKDDLAKNVWFVRDPVVMAKAEGLDPALVAPFTIDAAAGPRGALPQGGETVIDFPNNHLGYAITWFGLAATLAGIWLQMAFARRTPRG